MLEGSRKLRYGNLFWKPVLISEMLEKFGGELTQTLKDNVHSPRFLFIYRASSLFRWQHIWESRPFPVPYGINHIWSKAGTINSFPCTHDCFRVVHDLWLCSFFFERDCISKWSLQLWLAVFLWKLLKMVEQKERAWVFYDILGCWIYSGIIWMSPEFYSDSWGKMRQGWEIGG